MKRIIIFLVIFAGVAAFIAAQTTDTEAFRQEGVASWYGSEFDGKPTASGEIFNSGNYTAAHPKLPFGTILTVTNKQNKRQVTVRINDRGPFVSSRIVDLSKAAAEALDMIITGTAQVILERAIDTTLGPVISNYITVSVPEPSEPEPAVDFIEPVEVTLAEPVMAEIFSPETAPHEVILIETASINVTPPEVISTETASINVTPPEVISPETASINVTPPEVISPEIASINVTPPEVISPEIAYTVIPATETTFAEITSTELISSKTPLYAETPSLVTPIAVTPIKEVVVPEIPLKTAPVTAPVSPVSLTSPISPASVNTAITSSLDAPAAKIIGNIPPAGSSRLYRVQVGAYKIPKNATDAFDKLKKAGFNPSYEQHGDYYRVVLAKLKAAEIQSIAQKLGNAGFHEAIIRDEP